MMNTCTGRRFNLGTVISPQLPSTSMQTSGTLNFELKHRMKLLEALLTPHVKSKDREDTSTIIQTNRQIRNNNIQTPPAVPRRCRQELTMYGMQAVGASSLRSSL